MKWYLVENDYLNYLNSIDSKVQINTHDNTIKPFIGVLFKINGYDYFVQVSSAKSKHYKMSNKMIDMHKIVSSNRILSVLNINNMIPVPPAVLIPLAYADVDKYRTFSSAYEKSNYIALLKKELSIINQEATIIQAKAQKCYNNKIKNPTSRISERCCDFTLLEIKSKIYETAMQLDTSELPSTTVNRLLSSGFDESKIKEIFKLAKLTPQHKKMLGIELQKAITLKQSPTTPNQIR